eukprot:10791251-Alexandrium_andersonii.AAC.1
MPRAKRAGAQRRRSRSYQGWGSETSFSCGLSDTSTRTLRRSAVRHRFERLQLKLSGGTFRTTATGQNRFQRLQRAA